MSRSPVTDVLARHGLTGVEQEFLAALNGFLAEHPEPPPVPLTSAEQELLRTAGTDPTPDPALTRRTRARSGARYAALVATGMTVAEAAAADGVDPSRIRHRISERRLWALPASAGRRRLPRVQFDAAGRPLPGIGQVIRALPADLAPMSIHGFLATPSPDFPDERGEPMSAADFLGAGGDPALVAAAAEHLGLAP